MKKNTSIFIISFIALTMFYQNCSKMKFLKIDPLATVNRIPGGECVPGKKLSIYFDDADQTFIGDIVTYSGPETAVANYNYYSASAHPIHGPTPVGYEIHNFFYDGPDGLMLNYYGNMDSETGEGSPDNQFSLELLTKNNGIANSDGIVFVDDPNNADDVVTMTRSQEGNHYQARYHYWFNTDGSIIGPFSGESFEIRVKLISTGDLRGARFYSADGGSFNLGLSGNLSYIIKYRSYETCTD